MHTKNQIALPGVKASLPALLDFVTQSVKSSQLANDTLDHIRLAVEEAAINVIEHGYAGTDPGTICVSIQWGRMQVVVRVTDYGRAFQSVDFNPPKPTAEAILKTGENPAFGLRLLREAVDEVHYEATESANTLTLIKRL